MMIIHIVIVRGHKWAQRVNSLHVLMPLHAAELKHSTLVSIWVSRVRGCLDHQGLSPKQHKKYLLGAVVKTCTTGKITVCSNDLC